MGPEKITGVALQDVIDGEIVALPRPMRHHNLFALLALLNAKFETHACKQGFMTSVGRFVDRTEGMKIAKASGQKFTPDRDPDATLLFSEDLW